MMRNRYSGIEGRKKIAEVLLDNRLVLHKATVAKDLLDAGSVEYTPDGETLIEQGSDDDDVYFIISGQAAVFVNNREVGIRTVGETVGEMGALDHSSPRSATVKAQGELVTLKVPANSCREIWSRSGPCAMALAKLVSERLRSRARFHRPANQVPILFVGSSVESLPIARTIQQHFKYDDIDIRIWEHGIFGPSGVPVEELLQQVDESDFAVIVFGQDDVISSRGASSPAPRDNVVFELGLFMGRLGRERVFILREYAGELRLPSDLTGVTPLTYTRARTDPKDPDLGPPCEELRKAIRARGAL